MDLLGISEAEALEVIAADEAIDRGEKLFELSPEQEKAAKKARRSVPHKTSDNKPGPKERKVDNDKQALFEALQSAMVGAGADNVTVTTTDRQLDFEFNGRKFRVVLSAPRK